jgi:hypothetical protein
MGINNKPAFRKLKLQETTMRKSVSHREMIIWEFPACRTGWHVAIKKQIKNT